MSSTPQIPDISADEVRDEADLGGDEWFGDIVTDPTVQLQIENARTVVRNVDGAADADPQDLKNATRVLAAKYLLSRNEETFVEGFRELDIREDIDISARLDALAGKADDLLDAIASEGEPRIYSLGGRR